MRNRNHQKGTEGDLLQHPVLDLILTRARSGSKPLQREDGFKLGLAIEGGAMRGVVSAGMVTGLEYLSLLSVFDSIYGASAGSFNGAFFLAEQAAYGTTIYYEDINNRDFISLSRVFSSRAVANLEFILEHVLVKQKILDWRAVLSSPIPLKVVASSVEHLRWRVLEGFQTRKDLFLALQASSKMPFLAGPPVDWDGDRLLDASLFEAIPVHAALSDGCTHVLVLLTRPHGCFKKTHLLDKGIAKKLDKLKSGLGDCYLRSDEVYNETVRLLHESESKPQKEPFLLSTSVPSQCKAVANTEKDSSKLRNAARQGMSAVLQQISGHDHNVVEILTPFNEKGHRIRLS